LEHADKQLANRMLDGDEPAFEEFFESYATALYRFAASRLGPDSQQAEEVTQATLLKAITKLDTYRGEAGLFNWLCTFCRHEISAYYKRRKRRPREVELTEESHEIRRALDSAAGGAHDAPDTSLSRKELADQVHAAMAELPPRYGDVLEWKYLDGLSAREIAGRLGLSLKAAESLLTRARKAFREGFARRSRAWGPVIRRS
jgi:RNA polymerase sigma-70 factor (ECF subfamily)